MTTNNLTKLGEEIEKDEELFNFVQKTGNTIANVIEQMLLGNWIDDEGHLVSLNRAMLDLKGTLETAIGLNTKYYGA